jgi:hypothetical protein
VAQKAAKTEARKARTEAPASTQAASPAEPTAARPSAQADDEGFNLVDKKGKRLQKQMRIGNHVNPVSVEAHNLAKAGQLLWFSFGTSLVDSEWLSALFGKPEAIDVLKATVVDSAPQRTNFSFFSKSFLFSFPCWSSLT